MKNLRLFSVAALFIGLSVVSFKTFLLESEKRELKSDLIELSDVKYGVFNVDEWKQIFTDILTKKISEFEIVGENRDAMKLKISNLLTEAISDFKEGIHEKNFDSIKDFIVSSAISLNDYLNIWKEDIPQMTDAIMKVADNPENKELIKKILIDKLNGYADSTFAAMDYSVRDSLLVKYEQSSVSSAKNILSLQMKDFQKESDSYKFILIGLAVILGILILTFKQITKFEFVIFTFSCSALLIIGLFLPMIEIDARLSNVHMTFMGEVITFQDQVLYFKSKSIIEVVRLMLTQGGVDLLIVGVLVFLFSVLFPWAKLISGVVLMLSESLRENKILSFLVFKTGKWSMADVMVVAIFMAYIGFSGILTEQLNQIQGLSSQIELLTTNESNLQVGFFAFAMFAVLGLLLSSKLKKQINDIKK